MRLTILFFAFFVTLPIYSMEIYFKINEMSEEVTLTTSSKAKKGFTYLSQKEWNIHLLYSIEMFKNEYLTMSGQKMNSIISKKLKKSPKELKIIYGKGLVIEEAMKKLKIK